MKYSFKNGSLVCKETGETVPEISGSVSGIRTVSTESGNELVQLDLRKEGQEGDEQSVSTLVIRKYGDASLKILRCLYGIVDILAGKVITVATEAREGKSSLINVCADGELLTPVGYVEPYSYERRTLTDKILASITRAMNFRQDILVAVFDGEGAGLTSPEEVAGLVTDLRRAGRTESVKVVKHGFTSDKAAVAFLLGINAVRAFSDVHVFAGEDDSEGIALIWRAFTEEIQSEQDVTAIVDQDVEQEA